MHIAKGRSRCNFPLCKKVEIFEHYLAIIIKFSIVSDALHMLLVIVLSIVVFFSEEHVFHSHLALYAFRFNITMVWRRVRIKMNVTKIRGKNMYQSSIIMTDIDVLTVRYETLIVSYLSNSEGSRTWMGGTMTSPVIGWADH